MITEAMKAAGVEAKLTFQRQMEGWEDGDAALCEVIYEAMEAARIAETKFCETHQPAMRMGLK